MIKTIFTFLYLLLFWIFAAPEYWYLRKIKKTDKRTASIKAQRIVRKGFNALCVICGIKVEVSGKENIPTDRPVLYVCNHRSDVDAIVGYVTLPEPTGFVAKKELEKVPCIGSWMKLMNCVFIDRKNVREGIKAITQAISNVKEGYSMLIMPEGTRNQKDDMLPFKQGSFKIAEKTGCPIVPIAITNSDAVYERQAPRIKGAKVIVQYGKPIFIENMSKDEIKNLHIDVRETIKEMLDNQKDK